jgi:hypothetical protein
MSKASKQYILSDSSVNEYGFRLLTSGYQLASFAKNPIGYYMHKREDGVALKWEDLHIDGDNVVGTPVINMSNARGQQLVDEVENGFLNAASVGHIVVLEYSTDPEMMLAGQTGPTITKWYNKECSLVDIPGNANALTCLYDNDGNEMKLADLMGGKESLLNTNNSMEKFELSLEEIKALGLSGTPDAAAIKMGIRDLAARAENAEKALADLQDETTAKEVSDLLDKAHDDKKITTELKTVLASQYAGKPKELAIVLNSIPAFVSVNEHLTQKDKGTRTPRVQELMSKGWDALHKKGGLAELKAADEEAYNELYKGKHGHYPNQKTPPKK